MANPEIRHNKIISEATAAFNKEQTRDNLQAALEAVLACMRAGGGFIVPAEPAVPGQKSGVFQARRLEADGKTLFAAFTGEAEAEKAPETSLVVYDIKEFIKFTLRNNHIDGLLLDPWGESLLLGRELLQLILDADKPENHIYFEVCDITTLKTECIVNAANETLLGGGGVDGAIHAAAGPELLAECRTLGGCKTGEAKITFAYKLPAKYVIHTVGPVYSGSADDPLQLAACYRNSLELAKKYDLHSIAFPAISTGAYHYPLDEAIPVAMDTVAQWLHENKEYGMAVIFSCHDQMTYSLYLEYAKSCAAKQGNNC